MQDSKYLVANDRDEQWGLVVNTVGYDELGVGDPYPTKGHGDGYYFDVERGRVLDEYQLLYLVEGEGVLSTSAVKNVRLKAGDMFLVFPGVWHTYHPVEGNVWKSYWIGFKGRNMDDRMNYGFLSVDKPVYNIGYSSDVVMLYRTAIKAAKEEGACSQQLLAGIVNNLLGLMYSLERNMKLNRRGGYVEMIAKARIIIREGVESKITVHEIAAELGSSYSNFRKLFKEYTGMSPALYQQNLRLQRAKELLSSTDMSIKEIAYRLNFDSPDYFSSKFKAKVGCKPSEYRTGMKG